jgi:hypothetical protein
MYAVKNDEISCTFTLVKGEVLKLEVTLIGKTDALSTLTKELRNRLKIT